MRNEFEGIAALIGNDLSTMKRAVEAIQASDRQIEALINRTPDAKALLNMTIDKAYGLYRSLDGDKQIDTLATINSFESAAEYIAAIYTGMEMIFLRIFGLTGEDIKKTKKDADDEQRGWHKDLLTLASLDIHGVRTAIIGKEFASTLEDKFLGFRHLIRHNYPFKLDLHLVLEKMKQAPAIVDQFEKEIQEFLASTRQEFDLNEQIKGPGQ